MHLSIAYEFLPKSPSTHAAMVMDHFGVGSGPLVGRALDFLLEICLEEGLIGDAEIRQRLDQWRVDHEGR